MEENKRLRLRIPIVVEGKYDKIKLKSIVDATVLTTDGFGVFRNDEKRALIRKLCTETGGLLLLADSDGGGRIIRSHLRGMLDGIRVYDLYIPQIEGKEPRKAKRSKAGYLGVEGVPADILRGLFAKFAEAHPELCENADGAAPADARVATTAYLMERGYTGGADSQSSRDTACVRLGLPRGMSAKAFLEAVNLIGAADEI